MYGEIPVNVNLYIPRISYTSLEFIIRNIQFTELISIKSIIPLYTINNFNAKQSISNNFNIFPSEDTRKFSETIIVHFLKTTGPFPSCYQFDKLS